MTIERNNSVLATTLVGFRTALLFALVSLIPTIASAQAAKLSLADLLIGLRSQKVSIEDRNKILADAVKVRGITFELSDVIEQELVATGAAPILIAAVKDASPKPKPQPIATPIPTPTPPDHTFYAKRAETNASKGEMTLALADYDKAVELNSNDSSILAGRARTHFSLKSYEKALTDYDRVVELSPKDPAAFYLRGLTYERSGKLDRALADYKKAAELDPSNQNAAASLKRVEDEVAKASEAAKQKAAPIETNRVRPEFIEIGTLNSTHAEKLVTPTYPQLAFRAQIEGKVTVEVELDEEGKIVEAKATTGHQMLRNAAEDAVRRSKFKGATYEGTPIKARGTVVYSFNLRGSGN